MITRFRIWMLCAFIALCCAIGAIPGATPSASATTYYVDYVDGVDARAGTSEGTSWKHLPMDSRATGVPDGTTLNPGDTVILKSGVTYVGSGYLLFPSGTSGNSITFLGTGSGWGTGKARFTTNNTGLGLWTDNATTKNYFTFDGFEFKDIGGFDENDPIYDGITITAVDVGTDVFTTAADHTLVIGDDVKFTVSGGTLPTSSPQVLSGTGGVEAQYFVKTTPSPTTFTLAPVAGGTTINVTASGTALGAGVVKVWEPITGAGADTKVFDIRGGGTGIRIRNCDFSEIGQWKNTPPNDGANSVPGLGVFAWSVKDFILENCTFKRMKGGMGAFADPGVGGGLLQNVTVTGCTFTENLMWALDFAPGGSGGVLENITVSNCTIYDYFQFDDGNWRGFGDKPHTNGIFLRNSRMNGTWNNVRVHGCKFYADNTGSSLGGTCDIFISEGPSALIYNNIFWKNPKTNGHIGVGWNNYWATQPQVVRVYNNTFHGSVAACRTQRDSTTGATRNVHYANNLWVGAGSSTNLPVVIQWDHATTPRYTTLNRNLYWHPTFTKSQINGFAINGWYFATFENVQSMGVSPPNATQFEGDGKFQNPLITDMVGTFLNQDWRVLAGSPAIGLGYNLSEYFTTDIDGNARPSSGNWTVGAYEYGGAPPADVTAPTITAAVINPDGATGALTYSEPVEGIDLTHYVITGYTLSGLAGSGANWTFTISPIYPSGPDFTGTYTSGAGRTRDLAGNLLASGTVNWDNQSLNQTPAPPFSGRSGRAKPKGGSR